MTVSNKPSCYVTHSHKGGEHVCMPLGFPGRGWRWIRWWVLGFHKSFGKWALPTSTNVGQSEHDIARNVEWGPIAARSVEHPGPRKQQWQGFESFLPRLSSPTMTVTLFPGLWLHQAASETLIWWTVWAQHSLFFFFFLWCRSGTQLHAVVIEAIFQELWGAWSW